MKPMLSLLSLASLVPSALAQDPPAALSGRLRPVTAEVRDAGVLHLGTGTWTRHASATAELAGPGIFYANTCVTGYYLGLQQGDRVTDEGALPGPAMPTTPSTQIPGAYDTSTGFDTQYTINGFQIGYCTNASTFDATIAFHSGYQAPGSFCALPGAPTASFALTGLPASNGTTQACWTVTFDLTATSATFHLASTAGSGDTNAFGWSFQVDHLPSGPLTDGPILAGGVKTGASYADCSGTDATRWDNGTASVAYPGNVVQTGNFPAAQEEGTGMLTQDAFRIDSPSTPYTCAVLGGNPLASVHLELYSGSGIDEGIGQPMCFPGQNGVIACPCGNQPTNPGAGCNNSGQGQPATGGAILKATSPTGSASVSNDQVVLTATFVRTNTTSLFLQGNGLIAAGAVFGDGVRCIAGQLLRLNSPGGTLSDGTGTVVYPNAGFPQSITARVAALGQPISGGDTRWYGVYYRDPSLTFCPNPPGNTWNITQTIQLTWAP